MVTPNFWIDKTPKDPSQVASSQLTQSDRSVMATVTGTPESDPSVPAGMVEVTIPDSPEPPAVVPAEGGITSLGARVLCKRDSTGRITSASTPTSLPAGAEPVAVGVTGEWLATLDATTATTSAQVEAAQEKADQAAADALASLEAASKAVTGTTGEYAVGSSETVPPTSGWSTTPPVRTPGTFIWVRTTVTYGDGNSTTAGPVLLTGNTGAQGEQGEPGEQGPPGADGQDGQPGADGVGIASTVVTYASSTSATTPPTSGWTSQVPTVPQGHYLWTRTVWTYTTGATETGYSVAYMPEDGNDGENGIAGKDGVGIADTTITYAVSSSGTSAPSSGWQATPPAASAGQFMWTRTTWTYSDASTEVGYSVGKIGETGATGAAGKGIASTTVTYQASASGTTAPTGTWTSSIPSVAANQYLWARTVISYTDGTSTTGYSIGKMGATGADGAAGADGRGVQSTAVTYQAASSGTTIPTGSWSSSIPTVSAGQYLWTRTVITYTDATSSTSYAIGKMGEQGVKGDKGSTGATGTSVTSVTTYYRTVTKGAAAPAKPTASPAPSPWATTEPAYQDNTELYRTDRIVYSTGSFAYTDVSKVSAYTAAAQAITVANLVDAAAKGMVKASASDPGQQEGRIWLQLNASGQMIGIKVSNGTAWTSYTIMADQILVPSSVGTISLANGAITGPKISATAIDGKTVTGALIRTSADGQRVEIDSAGIHIYRVAADGTLVETIRLGVDGSPDYLEIVGADGNTLASINDEGDASFQAVDAGDSLTYQGSEMSDLLAALPQGAVVGSTLAADFIFSTGWARACDAAWQVTPGRMMRATFRAMFDATSSKIQVAAMRSSGPGVSSGNTVWRAWMVMQPVAGESGMFQTTLDFPSDEFTTDDNGLASLGFFVRTRGGNARILTTGSTVNPAAETSILLEDKGQVIDYPPRAGWTPASSGGSSDGAPSATRRTKIVSGSWGQSYRIDGSITTGMDPYAVQGSGGGPARMSMIGFPSITGDLSGATVNKIEVYLYFAHWWNNSGGTAGIGYHGQTSKPSSWSGTFASITKSGIPKPGGVWVTLPSSTYASFKSGAYRGITLRAPSDSTASVYYGYAVPGKCQLRYTYTK